MVPPSMHCAEGSRSTTLRGKRPVEVSGKAASEAFLRRRSPRLKMMEQSWTGGQRGAEPVDVNGRVDGSRGKRERVKEGEVHGGKKAAGKLPVVDNGVVRDKEVGPEEMPELKFEDTMSDEDKVKATMRLFNKTFLHCVQEEEERCGKQKVEAQSSTQRGSNRQARRTIQASLLRSLLHFFIFMLTWFGDWGRASLNGLTVRKANKLLFKF